GRDGGAEHGFPPGNFAGVDAPSPWGDAVAVPAIVREPWSFCYNIAERPSPDRAPRLTPAEARAISGASRAPRIPRDHRPGARRSGKPSLGARGRRGSTWHGSNAHWSRSPTRPE